MSASQPKKQFPPVAEEGSPDTGLIPHQSMDESKLAILANSFQDLRDSVDPETSKTRSDLALDLLKHIEVIQNNAHTRAMGAAERRALDEAQTHKQNEEKSQREHKEKMENRDQIAGYIYKAATIGVGLILLMSPFPYAGVTVLGVACGVPLSGLLRRKTPQNSLPGATP